MNHHEWLALGEAHLSRGHLRRALGAFRKSQQVDLRGDNAFHLHNAINALTAILLQQKKFFLHVNDEALLFERPLVEAVDLDALAAEALGLQATAKPAMHFALVGIERCLQARALLPEYADQSLTGDLGSVRPFAERWLDALKSLYAALLSREEPEQ